MVEKSKSSPWVSHVAQSISDIDERLQGLLSDAERASLLEQRAALRECQGEYVDEMGATGEFPDGKLTKSDDGALHFAVGHTDGKVVIDFGTPTAWVGMEPEQAVELAECLLSHARYCSEMVLMNEMKLNQAERKIEVETGKEQLIEWVKGNSLHGHQCCPDFSCCQDHYKAPRELREKFAAANDADRMKFLSMFLAKAFAAYATEAELHIVGNADEIIGNA